jgi:galactose mutarotase-like enzyme
VREPGVQFEIAASKDFGHTVLWAPPTRELFAVENQTSSTDAHNLANKGFAKESGLLELAAGAKWSGSVSYKFMKN